MENAESLREQVARLTAERDKLIRERDLYRDEALNYQNLFTELASRHNAGSMVAA